MLCIGGIQMTRLTRIVVLAALALPGCTASNGGSVAAGDEETLRFEESFLVTPDGIQLYVRATGSGPDTVIVPAAAWLAKDFGPLSRGRTLIFYDQRARGGSDAVVDSTLLGIDHEIRDIDFVRTHYGLESVSLIGWSYMGAVVALYAAEHPDRVERVVQIGPMPPTTELAQIEDVRGSPPDSVDRAVLQGLVESGMREADPIGFCREYLTRMLIRPMMGRPDSAARARIDPCIHWNEWPEQLFANVGHVLPDQWDYTDQARQVSASVLTIHGTDDPNAAVEGGRAWAELIPNARLVELEGVGHAPWLEAPDRFFAEVDGFLRGGS